MVFFSPSRSTTLCFPLLWPVPESSLILKHYIIGEDPPGLSPYFRVNWCGTFITCAKSLQNNTYSSVRLNNLEYHRKGIHANGWNLGTVLKVCPLQETFRTSIYSLKLLWHIKLSHDRVISLGLSSVSVRMPCTMKPKTTSTSLIPLLSTRHWPGTVYYLISTTLWDKCHCSHFINRETEDQWDEETFRVIQLFVNGMGIQTQGCLTPSDGFSHHTTLPLGISQSSDRKQTTHSKRYHQ